MDDLDGPSAALRAKTVTLRLSAVKAFLAYASYEDLTLVALSQAAKALKAPADPRTPIEYLNEAQTRAILAAFTGQRRNLAGTGCCSSCSTTPPHGWVKSPA